jgi:hypothetical protein
MYPWPGISGLWVGRGEVERGDGEMETDHVCVKVEDGNWLVVGSLQGAESWQGDGVVAAQGDEFRVDV